jgi:hypothetical protein
MMRRHVVFFKKKTEVCVEEKNKSNCSYTKADGFGGLVVSMLASGSRVRGFKPGRSRWIFNEC